MGSALAAGDATWLLYICMYALTALPVSLCDFHEHAIGVGYQISHGCFTAQRDA